MSTPASALPGGAPLTRQYRLTIDTLSPVHVGDGAGDLLRDVDFVVGERGRIYLIDQQKLWERVGEEHLAHWNAPEFRLSDLLRPGDYAACAAAVLPVKGHLESGSGLINQTADAHGRPYLPGSSLKGAIRTAVLRATNGPFDLSYLGSSRGWAGQSVERAHLGRNPNYDLLRALRVADSAPVDPSRLAVFVVGTYSLRGNRLEAKGRGYRLNVVAIPAQVRLEATLSLDRWTLGQASLGFGPRAAWLDELVARCNRAAGELIEAERRFYAEAQQPVIERFYAGLSRSRVMTSDTSFLLPVGWGTGWLAKTIGTGLRDRPDFGDVRRRFGLGRTGAPFPKSRRLVEEAPDRPVVPMGWVKVTLEEASR